MTLAKRHGVRRESPLWIEWGRPTRPEGGVERLERRLRSNPKRCCAPHSKTLHDQTEMTGKARGESHTHTEREPVQHWLVAPVNLPESRRKPSGGLQDWHPAYQQLTKVFIGRKGPKTETKTFIHGPHGAHGKLKLRRRGRGG